MQRFIFKRPAGIVIAVIGGMLIAGAVAGLVAALVIGREFDYGTSAWILVCVAVTCAIGVGMINAWRQPLLMVTPDALILPTFFGQQRIAVPPGHPAGEFLGPGHRTTGKRSRATRGNSFVHFVTLDNRGKPVTILMLHQSAPEIAQVRRALRDIAGLHLETLKPAEGSRSRPDISHWTAHRP